MFLIILNQTQKKKKYMKKNKFLLSTAIYFSFLEKNSAIK